MGGLAGILAVAAATALAAGGSGGRTGGTGTLACNDGTVTWSPTTLWPPDHKLHTITVTYTDNDNDGDSIAMTIGTITDNETTAGLEHGSGPPDSLRPDSQGSGTTESGTDPATLSTGSSVAVAAERSGRGTGRTYTIPVTCMDMGGSSMEMQTQTVDATVFVPHDQGQG